MAQQRSGTLLSTFFFDLNEVERTISILHIKADPIYENSRFLLEVNPDSSTHSTAQVRHSNKQRR